MHQRNPESQIQSTKEGISVIIEKQPATMVDFIILDQGFELSTKYATAVVVHL